MRLAVLAFVGLAGLAMTPATAAAFPAAAGKEAIGAKPYFQEAAQGCGRGYHWVGKHRNRYGAWVPGHCARN